MRGTPVAAWIAIVGALVYCPLITVFFRLGWIDQPTSGLLAGASVAVVVAISFPHLISAQRLRLTSLYSAAGASLALFVLVTAFSTFLAQLGERAQSAEQMWRQFAMAFSPALLFIIFRSWASRSQSHRPIQTGLDLLALMAIGSVALDLTGIFRFESYGARNFGVLGDSVAWLLSALLVLHISSRRWALFALTLLCLLATASRGPIVVSLVATTLLALLQPGRTQGAQNLRIGVLVILVSVVGFVVQFAPAVIDRFLQTDFFANDRIDTSRFSYEVFLREPILGSGYNSHSYYFSQVFGEAQEGSTVYSVATSTLAQSLADSGITGTLFLVSSYLFFMVVAFRVLRTSRPWEPGGSFPFVARGLSAWLIAFIPLNQTAGYILPNSQVGAFYFAVAGILVGYLYQRQPQLTAHRPPNPASNIRGVISSTSTSKISE